MAGAVIRYAFYLRKNVHTSTLFSLKNELYTGEVELLQSEKYTVAS